MIRIGIAAIAFSTVILASSLSVAVDPPAEKSVTLLGMLSEWQYPGSKFNGAEIGDAAVTGIVSDKSKAILTTSDAADKVLDFYLKQLNVDSMGKNLGEKAAGRITTKRAISVQDNSVGRPLKLYIICVNETDSSTTLTISRAENEETTHIAWSKYRVLPRH